METSAKDKAKSELKKLIERFHIQLPDYKDPKKTKEAQIEDVYIKPFWKLLGWDAANTKGNLNHLLEVRVQDRIEGSSHEPDYGFYIDGQRKFFLEAKQPKVDVKDKIEPAFQTRMYGFSGSVPISLLSDFEEFAVYDTRVKPQEKDPAHAYRLRYFTYEQYLEEWDWIWDVFAYENVINGSIDRFVSGIKEPKGAETVDVAFLNSLNHWRKLLAEDISLNHPEFDDDALTHHVQQTLDRLIFLRACEDRQIESYGNLRTIIGKTPGASKRLIADYARAASRYNSSLFQLVRDNKFGDDWDATKLIISDSALQQVVEELYPPKSPYAFAVIPVEILGNAYEQFLGKVIRVQAPARKGGKPTVVIEDKPEVRKAGGVFYTPQYIVEYIVKQTIGEWIKGKTPEEVALLRVCDPACGSGSFLLGAYKFLLDWHLEYYTDQYTQTKKKPAQIALGKRGDAASARLTTEAKKQILLNNIYGVDLDMQAVEVAKLSLMLRAIEGETRESVGLLKSNERVLPTLDSNLKNGNSLVGMDYFSGRMGFDPKLNRAVRAFEWAEEFPAVFKQSGFDIIIGNPPYVRQELLTDYKEYFKRYQVHQNTADLYTYFFEKSLRELLRPDGRFGIIVANKWMRAGYGVSLRNYLQKFCTIDEITDFGDLPVFKNAIAYPCIFLATRAKPGPRNTLRACNVDTLAFADLAAYVRKNTLKVTQKELEPEGWRLVSSDNRALLAKLRQAGTPLGEYVNGKIFYGIKTGLNEAFVIDRVTRDALVKADKKSADVIKPFLAGRDVKRYVQPVSDKFLIFAKRGIDINRYPAIKEHLETFKTQLMPKPKDFAGENWPGRKPGSYEWYELQDAIDYFEEFEKPKIVIPAIVNGASYTLDKEGFYSNDKTSIIGSDDLYLLAILNSAACDYYLKSIAATKQGGYFEYKPMYVSQLPIPVLNLKDKAQKARRDGMVKLVDELMALNNQLRQAPTTAETRHYQSRISATERKLNEEVYALYGLSKEEINLVEG